MTLARSRNSESWSAPEVCAASTRKTQEEESSQPPSTSTTLFEVESAISGPWQTGVLLSADGLTWQEPELSLSDLNPMLQVETSDVRLTLRDYGRPWLPSVPRAREVTREGVKWNPGTGMIQAADNANGFAYAVPLPDLPSADQLESGRPLKTARDFSHPTSPRSVQDLIGSPRSGQVLMVNVRFGSPRLP